MSEPKKRSRTGEVRNGGVECLEFPSGLNLDIFVIEKN
jgi:hypothetical protein